MLSRQVGRVKITRIVEMDLPVPATVFPPFPQRRFGSRLPSAAPTDI